MTPEAFEGNIPFKTVLDTVQDGIIILNQEGGIVSLNQAALAMLGYASQEIIGQSLQRIIMHASKPSPAIFSWAHHANASEEKFGKRKDGSIFPVELSLNEMLVGGRSMYVGTLRDITERKQHEEDRQRLMARLLESNTELERFAYVASHDLQEPIRMINNFGKILIAEYKDALDANGKEYLNMVTNSGERMRDVVSDLLEYSRISNETCRFHHFDGNMVLNAALENLRALIIEQQAVVTHDPLPQLYGSPVQIMRLLQNLISNGLKYHRPGQTPHIHIAAQETPQDILIQVHDDGMGIEPRFLKQIFDPFRRLHSWDEIKGSGLGLAICKKIAEGNSGILTVQSTLGEGSVFTLQLPKVQPSTTRETLCMQEAV